MPVLAVLLTAAAALVLDGLRGAAVDQALTSSLRERQRAFEAAELGLAEAEMALRGYAPVAAVQTLGVDSFARATITTQVVERDALPEGFSAGQLVAERVRVTSVGETTRGSRLTLEAGFTRLQPAP
jgi:Tfp pilus assembly protein PilX